jgi:cytochrome c553
MDPKWRRHIAPGLDSPKQNRWYSHTGPTIASLISEDNLLNIRNVVPRRDLPTLFSALAIVLSVSASSASRVDIEPPASSPSPPEWAYPVNQPDQVARKVGLSAIRVPGSTVSLHPAQLLDLFSAPDWHPADHPVMPDIVAQGRKPGVQACGYCHLPDGTGRPENASLAGLPAIYIEQQVRDFSSGARRTAVPSRLPPKLMTELSALATGEEIKTAAAYFSHLTPKNRIQVVETQTVPGTRVAGWIRVVDKSARREPIGQRIIEVPADVEDFENRDAHSRFVAYVPVGSVAAGQPLVISSAPDRPLACTACHGPDLKGAGNVPSIAGRSPSYIVRQLFDIQSGLRAGTQVAPMVVVAKRLNTEEMVEIAAYLATLH